jgi:ankyrin repeat protein
MSRSHKKRNQSVLPLLAALLLSAAGNAWSQTPAPAPPAAVAAQPAAAPAGPPPGDPLGPDLFIAIRNNNLADVKAVLAQGAKTEAPNWLGFTPLMWAAVLGNEPACEALITAGANVNAPSRFGNVLAYAELGGNVNVVRLLFRHGAKLSKDRLDNISPVMTAAGSGRHEALRLLLAAKGAEINAQDDTGATALVHAARRGQTESARILLDAGANVNTPDKHGRTALMYAARNGYPACTALLLARRALVNTRDKSGDTALLLAARYAGDPQVVRALLQAGADNNVKDGKSRSAFDTAVARENHAAATALRTVAASTTRPSLPARTSATAAAERGLSLIERSTKTFSTQAACVSCHHQGMGLMASGLARERGFAYDRVLAAAQTDLIVKTDDEHANEVRGVLAKPEMTKYVPAVDMAELTPALAFTYSGLIAHDRKPGEIQSAMTTILAGQQDADGKWGFVFHREPMQSSVFATTALTIRLLTKYLPADRAGDGAQRIEKARAWLLAAKAETNEDKTWRLLGLKWANAAASEIASATSDLMRAQRPDGGWAQLPANRVGSDGGDGAFIRSDAYATGQALYALHLGGSVPVTSDAYRRGVRYLLRTQDEDGSWLVTKRAIPANTYLDGGFPHGESQYSSYNATCWATMALLLATPPQQPTHGTARTADAR